jgi:hypothetical protein
MIEDKMTIYLSMNPENLFIIQLLPVLFDELTKFRIVISNIFIFMKLWCENDHKIIFSKK